MKLHDGQGCVDTIPTAPCRKPPLPLPYNGTVRGSGACAATTLRSRSSTPSTRASTSSLQRDASSEAAAGGDGRGINCTSKRSSSAPHVAVGAMIALTPAVPNSSVSCSAQSTPTGNGQQPLTEHGESCECVACQTHRAFHALLRSSGEFSVKPKGSRPKGSKPEISAESTHCPEYSAGSPHRASSTGEGNRGKHTHAGNTTVEIHDFVVTADGARDSEGLRDSQEKSLPSRHILVQVLESVANDVSEQSPSRSMRGMEAADNWEPSCAVVREEREADLQRREEELQRREMELVQREAKVQEDEAAAVQRAAKAEEELQRREVAISEGLERIRTQQDEVRSQSLALRLEKEEFAMSKRDLDREAAELADLQSDLQTRLQALKKEERILETRSKNLGFNHKRKQAQLEERVKDINKEALSQLQQQEQEAELERQKHKEAVERELAEMRREVEESVNQQLQDVVAERRKIERQKRGLTKQAEKELQDKKRALEEDLQKQLQVIESKRDELMLREMGVKASVPEYWQNQQLSATPHVKVEWPGGSKRVFDLLKHTCIHSHCAGRDGTFVLDEIHKVRVWRIENPMLWKQYCAKSLELESRHSLNRAKGKSFDCEPVQPPVPVFWQPSPNSTLNKELNEVMLWHGTKKETADVIVRDGFDERVCSLSGLFGAGLYFAQDSCKSGQYAARDRNNVHWFLLSRVLLGRPYYAKQAMNSLRKAPEGFDSVVYNGGGIAGGLGQHRELIVYDRFQAYPEYLIALQA